MKVLILFVVLTISQSIEEVKAQSRYGLQLSRLDCTNTKDLQYNDWVCSGPLKSIMNKKLNVKLTLYNPKTRYQYILYEQLTDLCSVEQSMVLYVHNYPSIKPTLGSSSSTLCAVVKQLDLRLVRFDKAVFPVNLPSDQYQIYIQVMDENKVEYFNIVMYFTLYTEQQLTTSAPSFLNVLFGSTKPPYPVNPDHPRY